MSDDFITRLEHQLADAERRRLSRAPLRLPRLDLPRAAAGLAAAAVVVLALLIALRTDGGEEAPVQPATAGQFTYRLTAGSVEEAAGIMRERLDKAEVEATVTTSAGALTINASPAAEKTVSALTQRGELEFYDWEPNVVGPPDLDTEFIEPVSRTEAENLAKGRAGTRLLRDPQDTGWYVITGRPALGNAEIARAAAGLDPGSNDPVVLLEFTAAGKSAFTELTRAVAKRGTESGAAPGGGDPFQHFIIVVDGRIVSRPFIDFREVPEGIGGDEGALIPVGLTPWSARDLAAVLDSGPLPGELVR